MNDGFVDAESFDLYDGDSAELEDETNTAPAADETSELQEDTEDTDSQSDYHDEAIADYLLELLSKVYPEADTETDTVAPISSDTAETTRPFLTTPFNDYTVTEGFLLLGVIIAFIAFVGREIRGFFRG